MIEFEMKTETEAEDLDGDLSDEVLDRTESAYGTTSYCMCLEVS